MQDRSIGVMTLAAGSAVVGLYCQLATVALLISGSTFFTTGSLERAAVLLLGTGFLAVTLASYAVAYGFWARRHWSWTLGAGAYAGLIVVSLALAVLSTSLFSAVLPTIGAAAALWTLHRAAIRAELTGTARTAKVTVPVGETMGVARQAH